MPSKTLSRYPDLNFHLENEGTNPLTSRWPRLDLEQENREREREREMKTVKKSQEQNDTWETQEKDKESRGNKKGNIPNAGKKKMMV